MRIRTVAFVLSLAILLLFILALLSLGLVGPGGGKGDHRLTSINITPEKQETQNKPSPKKVEVVQTAAAPPRPAPLQKPDTTPPPPPPPTPGPPGFIHLSHDELAASDISKMPKAAAGGGGDSGPGTQRGEGPGGAILYNARWYREPTDAEIAPYMKKERPPGAWAVIACKTVEHYHVEDCEEMGESPRGSGLAHGLSQAAWQFLIWPPRIDGKPQLGTWVRIRFDFTRPASETP